ncbi:iron ABC transporter substrate-binding protein [Paenibacillus swuensis]|uniref:Iron ABC transporter substrate-binding protein n=1 Tax=Paenibacillus swuensis TaxID=1178515 RepID=A0A172TIU6_9BACL|nr:iron uptake system protein EfeO [Paenibacillus swuensis]ANE46892.1 iron ABC transporter substrate-binding protein [Paenibacillus swuensis]
MFNPRLKLTAIILTLAIFLAACGTNENASVNQTTDNETNTATQEQTTNSSANNANFQAAVDTYHQFVIDQTDQFVKDTQAFTDAVKAGDMEKAKALYAPSRMYFERIEPIAESLGDFDPWIDAREGDVPAAEWKGFHRLEKALWQDKSVAGMEPVADALLQDVKQLRVKVENVEIDTAMLVTGAVELLNEVSSSKVTGEEERYSHTDLYDFAANVEGSHEIFKVLQPTVEAKNPELSAEVTKRFEELEATLAPYRKGEGFVLYTELKPEQVKKLSQAIDALAEPLSQIGTVVEG